jgi:hypothetical protein
MKEEFFIKELGSALPVESLEDLHLEICAGIARAKVNLSSRVVPHYEMQQDLERLYDLKMNESARIGRVADEGFEHIQTQEEMEIFKSLNHEQKKKFLLLYRKAYCDGEFVRLRFTRQDSSHHPFATFYDSMCEWHGNIDFFPKTVEFIHSLPFREVGRVLLFVSYHYDRKDECFDGRHHFIWFNPFHQKKFFLLDDQKREHFVQSKAAFFNTRFLHGAKPSNFTTYSLRVDGQLEEEFCKTHGILWKPR